jgi:hypothetical protein
LCVVLCPVVYCVARLYVYLVSSCRVPVVHAPYPASSSAQRAVDEGLKESRRLARLEAAKLAMRAQAKAILADRGRFDPLDSIMNPAPPVKVKRRPVSRAKTPEPVQPLSLVEKPVRPILLQQNAAPRKVQEAHDPRLRHCLSCCHCCDCRPAPAVCPGVCVYPRTVRSAPV